MKCCLSGSESQSDRSLFGPFFRGAPLPSQSCFSWAVPAKLSAGVVAKCPDLPHAVLTLRSGLSSYPFEQPPSFLFTVVASKVSRNADTDCQSRSSLVTDFLLFFSSFLAPAGFLILVGLDRQGTETDGVQALSLRPLQQGEVRGRRHQGKIVYFFFLLRFLPFA